MAQHQPAQPARDPARRHREEREADRANARQLWEDGGWVFATATGGPLNPNTDYHQWKVLLAAAGLGDARLHDARHEEGDTGRRLVLRCLRAKSSTVTARTAPTGGSGTDRTSRNRVSLATGIPSRAARRAPARAAIPTATEVSILRSSGV